MTVCSRFVQEFSLLADDDDGDRASSAVTCSAKQQHRPARITKLVGCIVVPGSTRLRIISNRRRTLARVPPFRQPPLILYRVACLPNAKSSHHLSYRSYSRSYPCTNVESLPVNRLLQITRSTSFHCVASRRKTRTWATYSTSLLTVQ